MELTAIERALNAGFLKKLKIKKEKLKMREGNRALDARYANLEF